MASVTLNVAPTISSGTVTVYPQSNWPYGKDFSGSTVGASVASGSVVPPSRTSTRELTCVLPEGHDGPVHEDKTGEQWGDIALPAAHHRDPGA